jgi:hypothetical protein
MFHALIPASAHRPAARTHDAPRSRAARLMLAALRHRQWQAYQADVAQSRQKWAEGRALVADAAERVARSRHFLDASRQIPHDVLTLPR